MEGEDIFFLISGDNQRHGVVYGPNDVTFSSPSVGHHGVDAPGAVRSTTRVTEAPRKTRAMGVLALLGITKLRTFPVTQVIFC